MLHFAFLLTDIQGANGASLIYDPNGIETQTKEKGWYGWNSGGLNPWVQFQNFYEQGYGGKNAFNTGDWAIINDFDDSAAAELYRSITGSYPADYQGVEGSCPAPASWLAPPLPAAFYAMEHFNFPTIVHKFTKPVFDASDLPAVNDSAFHAFPWHNDLTKPAEATDAEAIHPHKPGNTSGITLGRGFDLSKFANKTTVLDALKRVGIDNKSITDAAGLSVSAANSYWQTHKAELQNINLTAEQQYLLSLYSFKVKEIGERGVSTPAAKKLYDNYVKGTSGVEWDDFSEERRDVLFDINYRGDWTGISGYLKNILFDVGDGGELVKSPSAKRKLCEFMHEKFWIATGGDSEGRWIYPVGYQKYMERNENRVLLGDVYGAVTRSNGSAFSVPLDRFIKRAKFLEVDGKCQ